MAQRGDTPFDGELARKAVIKVGGGRGCVLETKFRIPKEKRFPIPRTRARTFVTSRIVVTAAHCLPSLPPPHPGAPAFEKTFKALLGPINSQPSIMAECLFVDPVADIAVLGEPDGQEMCAIVENEEDLDAFADFIGGAGTLRLSDMPRNPARAWLLSLDGRWTACGVKILFTLRAGPGLFSGLFIEAADEGIVGGMSGSPILLDDGNVIGLLSTSEGQGSEPHTKGGPQPWLMHCLPAGLVQQIRKV